MMDNLKTCPFCGGEAEVQEFGYYTYVRCINKKCAIKPITACYLDEERAVKEWNRREGRVDGEQDDS